MSMRAVLTIAFLFVLNVIPAIGLYFEIWPRTYVLYIYLAEAVILGAISLSPYIKHLLVFFLLLGLLAFILNLIDLSIWRGTKTPVTFWSLYSLCWLIYFEIGKSTFGLWLKRLAPFQHFLFYLLYMILATTGCMLITATIFDQFDRLQQLPFKIYLILFSLSFAVPTLTIGLLRIIDMIGPKHFLHFLFGTYHRPIEKQRIVLFLDMVGSSSMAEQLKARRAMALIARFIFDSSLIFRLYGGDIINYTGDGLVVLWPIAKAEKAVSSVEALQARLEKNKHKYEREFGMMPDFRIGIHAGKVVISQIGEEKLFLGLYGDVVNTAARLEGMAKKLGTKVIFSQAVKRRLSLEKQKEAKAMGIQDVRGRDEKIEVFTLLRPLKSIGTIPDKESISERRYKDRRSETENQDLSSESEV